MTPDERAQRMAQLTRIVQQLAFAGMRARYPDATDDEIWLRLASPRTRDDAEGLRVGPERGMTAAEPLAVAAMVVGILEELGTS